MTGLAITLSVGIIFTGISNIHPAMPAKCAFTTVSPRRILPAETITMVFSEIILLGGLLIRLLEISSTISRRSSKGSLRAGLGKPARRVLVRFAEKLQRSSRPSRALFTPLVVFFLAFLITVQTVLDALVSHICGVGDECCPTPWALMLMTLAIMVVILAHMGHDAALL